MKHPANVLSDLRTHPRIAASAYRGKRLRTSGAHGIGDSLFTVTANTSDSGASSTPIDTSNPLVTLLLGAALGAGVVTLIFTWK